MSKRVKVERTGECRYETKFEEPNGTDNKDPQPGEPSDEKLRQLICDAGGGREFAPTGVLDRTIEQAAEVELEA